MEELKKHEDDPMIYPEPTVEIGYEEYNIADELILAYRKVTNDSDGELKKNIIVYVDLSALDVIVVNWTEDVENKLQEIIEERNMRFRRD